MKTTIYKLYRTLLTIALAGSLSAETEDLKTEIPFMELGPSLKQNCFPLISTTVDADVIDGIIKATVTQVYKNTEEIPIEAIYTFPLSNRAAVHAMKMNIGDRSITAKIKEKQEAKKIYQQAKEEKKAASLLEQKRPNVFQTKVANILPGETVEVVITFSELLIPEENVYEWVFPTVVGSRYSGDNESSAPEAGDFDWVNTPYFDTTTPQGMENFEIPVETKFTLNATLKTSLAFTGFQCPSHQPEIDFVSKEEATVVLDSSQSGYQANRDFILRFKLVEDQIVSGLMAHHGEEENFFLINVQPPERVMPEHIPPREYLFVIDVSGSMNGFPLKTAKKLFEYLANNLRPIDQFNIQCFSGGSEFLAKRPLPATPKNIQAALNMLDQMHGGGGTELNKALGKALSMTSNDDLSRNIVIITDGYISADQKTFGLIREKRGTANIYSFGIGSSVNRHLIDGMAKVGGGEPFIVTQPKEAKDIAKRFADYIASPVLTNIKISSKNLEIKESQPARFNDLFANRALVVTGKWKSKNNKPGKITIEGTTGNEEAFSQTFTIDPKSKQQNLVLRDLWARETVRELMDFNTVAANSDLKKQITNLGLEYELITPYTSFVAVDELPREFAGKAKSVTQPLPLPAGVNHLALAPAQTIGNGSIPEPSSTLLLLITAVSALCVRKRD